MQTIRQRLLLCDVPQRRWECGNITHIGGDTFETTVGKLQTVVQRIILRHLSQILSVGIKDPCLIVDNGIGNGIKNLVALLVVKQCQTLAGTFNSFESIFKLHMSSMLGILCEVLIQVSQ